MKMNEYVEEFQVVNDVLHVRLSGRFPNEILRKGLNAFQPLIDACSEHGCRKALVDARDLQIDFDTMELFNIGEDATFLTRLGLRVALLAREDMLDRFFENVVYNRGGVVGIFTDVDSANDWLEG